MSIIINVDCRQINNRRVFLYFIKNKLNFVSGFTSKNCENFKLFKNLLM